MEMERIFVNGTSELLKKLVCAIDEELDRISDRTQDLKCHRERLKRALGMIEALICDPEMKQLNFKRWLIIEELLKKLVSVVDRELARGGDGVFKSLKGTLEMMEAVTCDAERKQVNDPAVKGWLIKLKEVAYDADDVLDEHYYKAVMQSKRNIKVDPVINYSIPDIIEKFSRLWLLMGRRRSSKSSSYNYNQQEEKVSVLLSDHSELKLRYDNLSSHLKQCFSYFSLFPKDWKFDRVTLIQLWMAEGFLEPSNGENQNSLEDIGNEYFNNFLSFSLFQNVEYDELGDTVTFELHNFVHDFAQSVAGRHEVTVFGDSKEYEKYVCKLISFSSNKVISENITSDETRRLQLALDDYVAGSLVFSGKKLRTILCNIGVCQRVDIRSLQLRVLHLSRVGHLNIPLLLRLRYLRLNLFDVNNVSISQLYLLQTLNLSGCNNVHKLLEEIGSLEMLRHLDFSSSDVRVLPESIFTLFNLRTLNISRCEISVLPISVGALQNLMSLDISYTPITKLPDSITDIISLRRLKFHHCLELKALPSNLGALTQLRSLDLEGTGITELPDSLTSNLWKFEYVNIRNLRVLMPYLVRKLNEKKNAVAVMRNMESSGIEELAGLHFLRVLEIRHLENVRDNVDAERAQLGAKLNLRELSLKWEEEEEEEEEADNNNSVTVLEGLRPHQNLEKLVIENFGGVRLPKWMASSAIYCLPHLVELYLSNCNRCEKLPALGMLPCLRILWIYGMRSMTSLGQEFYYQEEEGTTTPVTKSFPSLTRLELGDMDNLEEWFAPPPPFQFFPVLEALSIVGCCELTYIPDFQSCTSLRELTVEDCDKLNKESPSEVYQLPNSVTADRCLVKQINSGTPEDSGIQDIAALENEKCLHIKHLENVRGGKEGAETAKLKDKQHLEDLYFSWSSSSFSNDECEVLEGLQPHPNLKKLTISGFRGVELPRWMGSSSNCLPNLVEVYLEDCNRCEKLPALGMLPCLKFLQMKEMNSVQSLAEEFYYQQPESSSNNKDGVITEKEATTSSLSSGISVFPSLVELNLIDMSILEEWDAPRHSFNSFPSLEKLIVSGCLRLRSIPFASCSSLQSLVLRNTNDEVVNQILSSTGVERTTSLPSVLIQYSPQLQFFPALLLSNDTCIQSLEIAHCSNFQGFRILDNDEFQEKVSSDTESNASISSLPSLKLFDCPALTAVPDLRKWTSLTELWIEDCDKLKESFSYSLKSLKYLKTLYVDRVIDMPQK